MMKHTAIALILFFATLPAQAGYLTIGESGEMLPLGEYQFGVAPQLLLNNGGGANVDAFIDTPFNDSTSFRIQAGAGEVDFHAGAGVKFVPFPDIENQPAIGAKTTLWYARTNDENILTVQLAPLVSRKLPTDHGVFVPYIAIPVNITNAKSRNYTGIQFVAGSEWRNPEWPTLLLSSELAIDLNDSYSALTFGISFPFDGERGFRR